MGVSPARTDAWHGKSAVDGHCASPHDWQGNGVDITLSIFGISSTCQCRRYLFQVTTLYANHGMDLFVCHMHGNPGIDPMWQFFSQSGRPFIVWLLVTRDSRTVFATLCTTRGASCCGQINECAYARAGRTQQAKGGMESALSLKTRRELLLQSANVNVREGKVVNSKKSPSTESLGLFTAPSTMWCGKCRRLVG